jgi:membrane peptidoglycan carboxypeptidase
VRSVVAACGGLCALALFVLFAGQTYTASQFPQIYWQDRKAWMLRPAVVDADSLLVGFLPPASATDLDAAHAVQPDGISDVCVDLVLAREDAHHASGWRYARGIDFVGVVRAALRGRGGASTLPMQTARQLAGWQTTRAPWVRKLLELGAAQSLLDLHGGDHRALARTYLSIAPFAQAFGDVRGITSAADVFFAKRPSALTAEECAFLVVLLPKRLSLVGHLAATPRAWQERQQQAQVLLQRLGSPQAALAQKALMAWPVLPPRRPELVGYAPAVTVNLGARTRALVAPHTARIAADLTPASNEVAATAVAGALAP